MAEVTINTKRHECCQAERTDRTSEEGELMFVLGWFVKALKIEKGLLDFEMWVECVKIQIHILSLLPLPSHLPLREQEKKPFYKHV